MSRQRAEEVIELKDGHYYSRRFLANKYDCSTSRITSVTRDEKIPFKIISGVQWIKDSDKFKWPERENGKIQRNPTPPPLGGYAALWHKVERLDGKVEESLSLLRVIAEGLGVNVEESISTSEIEKVENV